jgi:hypothetical protein
VKARNGVIESHKLLAGETQLMKEHGCHPAALKLGDLRRKKWHRGLGAVQC